MEAYRAEVSCINRLRHEIIHLRALTCSQQQLIATLAVENEELRRERFSVGKLARRSQLNGVINVKNVNDSFNV